MFKKLLVFALIVNCSAAVFAQTDYLEKWNAAYKLYQSKKYAEAMSAFAKLAENTSDPMSKYNCYMQACYSARSIKKYDEAIAFADKASKVKNPYLYKGAIRKLDYMCRAGKYNEAIREFTIDKIMEWPKFYRSEALSYIGLAQSKLNQNVEAANTLELMYQNAEDSAAKANAALQKGSIYSKQLKDMDQALAAYRQVLTIPKVHPRYKSRAYDNIAVILFLQKRYDEALAVYDKQKALPKNKSHALFRKGLLLKTLGRKTEAIKCFQEIIAAKDCSSWYKKLCQKQLKRLESKK